MISDGNVLIIGICNFDTVCNLSIVIWDFSHVSGKAIRYYPNQYELSLTFPCPPWRVGLWTVYGS